MAIRSSPEHTRRCLLQALAALALPASLGARAATLKAQPGMNRLPDITLPYRLYSNPLPWRPKAGEPWAIAVVGGEMGQGSGVTTFVDALGADGRHLSGLLHGFPVLRKNPAHIAPAQQLALADVNGDGLVDLLALDFQGGIQPLRPSGRELQRRASGNPAHGLLVWPAQPVALGGGRSALLMVSRDAAPAGASRHGLDLVLTNGQSLPGFPRLFDSPPEAHAPMVALSLGRAYALMENGQVEAVQLADGRSPAGFPAGRSAPDVVAGTRRMAWLDGARALFITQGSAVLHRVDGASGAVTPMTVQGAIRLTGLASVGERLYALDEARGTLLTLDARGAVQSSLALNLPADTAWVSLQAVALGPAAASVLVVAAPKADRAARVNALFEKHATPQDRKEIKDIAEATAMDLFGTLKLNAEQRKEIDASVQRMRQGTLENKLGSDEAARLLTIPPTMEVRLATDSAGSLVLTGQDRIDGHTPDTELLQSPQVHPAAMAEAGLLTWVVPANAPADPGNIKAGNRAVLRRYQHAR